MIRPTTIRINSALIEELRQVARRWSFRQKKDYSWSEVLEFAIRAFLREEEKSAVAGKPSPVTHPIQTGI